MKIIKELNFKAAIVDTNENTITLPDNTFRFSISLMESDGMGTLIPGCNYLAIKAGTHDFRSNLLPKIKELDFSDNIFQDIDDFIHHSNECGHYSRIINGIFDTGFKCNLYLYIERGTLSKYSKQMYYNIEIRIYPENHHKSILNIDKNYIRV